MIIQSIQDFYRDRLAAKSSLSPLDSAALQFLQEHNPQSKLREARDSLPTLSPDSSPIPSIDTLTTLLQQTLAIQLMLKSYPSNSLHSSLSEFLQEVRYHSFWLEHQPSQALFVLNAHLANLPYSPLSPRQFSSGAAPMEDGGHWPWAEVPHLRPHADLGILWALLGVLQKRKDWIQAAVRLAEWQLNTLDSQFLPMHGLYTLESEATLGPLLVSNALLFHITASLSREPRLEFVAQKQLWHLREHSQQFPTSIAAHQAVIAQCIDSQYPPISPQSAELEEGICDPYTALVGLRCEDVSVACTLMGGHTGMGYLKKGETAISAYGPQLHPLDHPELFGILRGCKGTGELQVTSRGDEFVVKGRCQVTAEQSKTPSPATYRIGAAPVTWMEAEQLWKRNQLMIQASFYSLSPLNQTSFAFYVHGESCLVNHECSIHSQSLERYQGRVAQVQVESPSSSFTIHALPGKGELQIIPLAGGECFWGADFLISYTLDNQTQDYTWQIDTRTI